MFNAVLEFTGLFDEAQKSYDASSDDLVAALRARVEQNRSVARLKRDLEEVEAELQLDGAAEGKNETERKAKLRLALRDNPRAKAISDELDVAQAALEVTDVEIEALRLRLSACRAQRQIAIAAIQALSSFGAKQPEEV